MTLRRSRLTTLLPLATLAGCTAAAYVEDADREVQQLMRVETDATLGNRAEWVIQPTIAEPPPPTPEPAVPNEPPPESPTEPPPETPPATPPVAPPEAPTSDVEPTMPAETPAAIVFDLQHTLATAVQQNREFLARREGLYRQGLSLSLTRFQFGPQFAAAVSYLWPRSENGFESHQTGGSFTASQILPTGGSLSLSSGLNAQFPLGFGAGDPTYGSNAGITLRQPLLRGAGAEIAYEPLTQAEREITYAIRDFENFREGFTIQITQRFFELTSQKKTLANEDRNYESAVFDRQKAEALQQVGRNTEQEVFRARRREIDAKDQLINAHAAYDRAVDDFKILLGLSTETVVTLAEVEPPFERVHYEVTSAIQAAQHNRLDLITARQQLEDVERSLRIAENSLLPNLDFVATFGVAGLASDLGHSAPDLWQSSVGLSMEIPLQRKAQRNSYRSSLISMEQARRGLRLTEDQLELDIRDSVRRLQSLEERVDLQVGQIEQERAAVTVIEIRYEAGQVDNRDLLEARQALIDAQNALIRLKVDHFVARLNLLKDMGIFFVDDQGMWR